MRFIVYGAGAIGCTLAARLHQAGRSVVLIGRGEQARVLRDTGLSFESHDGLAQLQLPIAAHPRELEFQADDVVVLAMKTQDTAAALDTLVSSAPAAIPIACAQNGVENERLALRRFENVQGIAVMCPTAYLRPGVVQAFGTPLAGNLDIGRYPSGCDAVSEQLAEAFRAARFDAQVRPDILRFKYGKLLFNLGNAIEAVCGPEARHGTIGEVVRREAIGALTAARIDFDANGAAMRGKGISVRAIGGSARPGGSSWQSLWRRTGSIETDHLNGEIVLAGRTAGFPTPANELLQRLSNQLAREHRSPGELSETAFLSMLQDLAPRELPLLQLALDRKVGQ